MASEKITAVNAEAEKKTEEAKEDLKLVFDKPYKFEGETYKEVSLEGLKEITAQTMIDAEKYYGRTGDFSVIPEMTMDCACYIASKVTDKPIEFFLGLPAWEAIKLRNRVRAFMRDAG